MFRQYINQATSRPASSSDDIIRSGHAVAETVALVKELGAEVIAVADVASHLSPRSHR